MRLQGGGQPFREQLIRCRKTRHQSHQLSIDSELPVRMVVEVPLAGLALASSVGSARTACPRLIRDLELYAEMFAE